MFNSLFPIESSRESHNRSGCLTRASDMIFRLTCAHVAVIKHESIACQRMTLLRRTDTDEGEVQQRSMWKSMIHGEQNELGTDVGTSKLETLTYTAQLH